MSSRFHNIPTQHLKLALKLARLNYRNAPNQLSWSRTLELTNELDRRGEKLHNPTAERQDNLAQRVQNFHLSLEYNGAP